MTNHNEEIEILSHEDETRLDTSGTFNKLSDGDSEENISTNKENDEQNTNQNINREEINNNNIDSSQNIKGENNNIDSNLKYSEPEKRYKNYNQPFGHSNKHHLHYNNLDFSNPRHLFYFILGYIKMKNYQVQEIFEGLCMTLDMHILNTNFHPLVKRFLHIKQVLLLIYIICIQFLLSVVEKIFLLNFLNDLSLNLMILFIFFLYIHYYYFNNILFLEKDEEIEKFILKRNPQMKKGRCEECDLIKVLRSNHCPICKKCIKKYQFHSDWFNICIGGSNELLYSITLFFSNGYIFFSNTIFWYYILLRSDLLKYLFIIYILFALIEVYILFNSLNFLYDFIFECLFVNLTIFEKNNYRRLTYLWHDARNSRLFNPFNKGLQRNLEEMWINLFDIDIYSDYKNFECQNLSEIIDDEKINKQEEEIEDINDISSLKLMIKLTEHIDPFLSSKGNIYKFVDGKEIINWNRLMIFTAFDIINSPFKEYMIKNAKNKIKQRELYLKSINQGNEDKNETSEDNKKENKNNEKDENDENNENSENLENLENEN